MVSPVGAVAGGDGWARLEMASNDSDIRAFIALHISEQARQTLDRTIHELADTTGRQVRWVDPQGIHLTLKFLGNIPSSRIGELLEAVEESCRDHAPFQLVLTELGMFPNRERPRVLWAGVGGDLDSLASLQEAVEIAMTGAGFQRERRPFRAHLTIGRVRDGATPKQRRAIGDAVSSTVLPPVEPWRVSTVHLVRSNLTPQGAVYSDLGTMELR